MYVCMYGWMDGWMYAWMYGCMCVWWAFNSGEKTCFCFIITKMN